MEQVQQELKAAEEIKTSTDTTEISPGTEIKGKVIKKSGKRIGYNYIILKSLKKSQKNDVVKCLYIKSLINFGICVIKEGTYGDSKDREGRDIKDRLMWQKQLHEKLQDKVRLPRYLGSFEENGNYYLVIERIKGKPFYQVCKEKSKELREGLIKGDKLGFTFLNYIIQIIDLVNTMHLNKVIHRDVTSSNFIITPSGKVSIIDMELCYSFEQQFPSPPFQLGTHGYMSPQQESMQHPSIKDDIFPIGAIMLQMWTGISPSKLTNAPIDEICDKVYFLVPDRDFANIIIQCLQPDPEKRPSLPEVKQVLKDYEHDLKLKKKRVQSKPVLFTREDIINTIQQSINTLGSPLLADPEKGWFSEDSNITVSIDKKKIVKAWYASFNKGVAGVLYTLSKAKQVGFDTTSNAQPIEKALELIESKYITKISEKSPGLHYGCSGIAVCLSNAILENLFEPKVVHFEWINQLIALENTNVNYIDGIAGQGLAHLHCKPFLHEGQMQDRLKTYTNTLLSTQAKDGYWVNEIKGKEKKTTKGFARGTAGIIYYLLEYAMQYQEREPLKAAKQGLEWLMKTAIFQKDAILWRSSAKKEIHPNWREGAPGIALTFMKAYSLLNDPIYKKFSIGALKNNPPDHINNNISQYDGLSGLGEIYLQAADILQDSEWYDRASWIVQVIMRLKKVNSDYGPYWLVDHEKQPVSDFMWGNSGIIHFLLRYCHHTDIPFALLGKP